MPIHAPIVTEIAHKTYLINEFGLDACFVLVGSEKALLIDTGSGYCELPALVRSLTDLPFEVVLTHGHVDHAGGCDAFEKVWLHPADHEAARSISYEARLGYGEALRGAVGDADVWDYGEKLLHRWERFPQLLPLADGQVFDLGGRRVSVIYTPGHTPGSCCLIDDKSRILFSGDAANVHLLMNLSGAPVSTALRGLLRVKAREAEFDRNYNGHMGYSSFLNCTAMPDSVLDDCIAAFRGILDGSLPVTTYENFLHPEKPSYAVELGAVRVSFDPEALWEAGEEQAVF
jgi:glyoxylase-like metal-dependent hydrolase (beta-lactamase superfamily II)